MTGGRKRLRKAMGAILSGKQDKDILVPALLGAYRNGQPTIIVAGRPDFVYVRLRGSQSEVVQAFNEKVAFHFDLPILVLRDENFSDRWIVHGRDIGQYATWEGSAYGVAHASSHAFAGADRTGSDIVWVNKCQYMPLLPRPEASGTMGLWIESDFYYFAGRYHWWPGSGTADLSGFRPTGAMNARYVTVYIDADGNPAGLAGPEFDKVYPGDPADYISIPDPDDGVVVAAVLFMTGTQAVGWGEIFDLRNPNQPPAPTGSPIWIADESAVLGKVWGLNFVGEYIQAFISGSYGHVVVAHSGTFSQWWPDAPQPTGSAYDDEFSDQSLDGKWTEFDPGNWLALSETQVALEFVHTDDAGTDWAGICEAFPTGTTAWTVASKMSLGMSRATEGAIGLCLFEDAISNPATSNIWVLMMRWSNAAMGLLLTRYNDYQNWASNDVEIDDVFSNGTMIYQRVRRNGATYDWEWSSDGVGFLRIYSGAAPFTPKEFGIITNNQGTGAELRGFGHFIRYVPYDVGINAPLAGQRIWMN